MNHRPKLVRDWEGAYVRYPYPLKNGMMEIPANTTLRVKSSGIRAYFEAIPCKCCGVKMQISIKGKDKFKDATYLGHDEP